MELTGEQFKKLADIFADIGQVCLASIAIPFFLDTFEPIVAWTGLLLACVSWVGSLFLIQRAKTTMDL